MPRNCGVSASIAHARCEARDLLGYQSLASSLAPFGMEFPRLATFLQWQGANHPIIFGAIVNFCKFDYFKKVKSYEFLFGSSCGIQEKAVRKELAA
jgi:hypothetical protein